jgi:hypothetical protein
MFGMREGRRWRGWLWAVVGCAVAAGAFPAAGAAGDPLILGDGEQGNATFFSTGAWCVCTNDIGFVFRNGSGTIDYTGVSGALVGYSKIAVPGVRGVSTNSNGVIGQSVPYVGVVGRSTNDAGVLGESSASYGVIGRSTNSNGVYGTSPNFVGVVGNSTADAGVLGTSTNSKGVIARSTNSDGLEAAAQASSKAAVYAHHDGSASGYGIYTRTIVGTGIYASSGNGTGIFGYSSNGTGVLARTGAGTAVFAGNDSTSQGVAIEAVNKAPNWAAVYAHHDPASYGWGITAVAPIGVGVRGQGSAYGVHGTTASASGSGVFAENTGGGTALKVTGKTAFSRSGVLTLASSAASITKTGVPLTSASYVLATLQTNTAGLFIRGRCRTRPGAASRSTSAKRHRSERRWPGSSSTDKRPSQAAAVRAERAAERAPCRPAER